MRGCDSEGRQGVAAVMGLAIGLGSVAMTGIGAEPDHTVLMRDIKFHPKQLKLDVGDTIEFINKDPFQHDVYIVPFGNPNQPVLSRQLVDSGERLEVTLEEKGVFRLYCTIHGGMTGRLTTTGSFEPTAGDQEDLEKKNLFPEIARQGERLFWGKAQCSQCHQIGERGEDRRGPNLADIGLRASQRSRQLGLNSGTEYITWRGWLFSLGFRLNRGPTD